jgi:integrase
VTIRWSRVTTYGERGSLVRLWKLSGDRKAYVVQWTEQGGRVQRAFPLTAKGKQEAEAFAKAFVAHAPRAVRTTRALWDAYQADQFPTLRPNSRRLYATAWAHWEKFYGGHRDPSDLTLEECGEFRRWLDVKAGLGLNTARGTIRVVRTVYNWGEPRDLITKNRWHGYRFKVLKGTEPAPRAEYRAEEFLAMWRELDPAKATQWRAWVALGLLGIYGNRQHAILALRWEWITEDTIVIPAAVEKTGKAMPLPMLPLTAHILSVAKGWRERVGYDGPHVLFAGSSKGTNQSYTIQSFWAQLRRVERDAKVPRIVGRAGHGFRRMLVGDLADATGDVGLALQAIGDSLAMAKHYRTRRDDRIRDVLTDRLARMMPEGTPQSATESATSPDSVGDSIHSNEG